MKRRIFTAALACAMALSLLSACGPKTPPSSGSSAAGSDVSTMAPEGSASQPDASLPDTSASGDGSVSAPDGSGDLSGADSSKDPAQPDDNTVVASLSLNKSDFTLFKAGATFQLKAQGQPTGGQLSWKSDNEQAVTVSDKGLVTAAAPGKATVTVTDSKTGLSASCIVRCDWEEKVPDNGGSSSGSGSSSSSGSGSSSSTASVDLSAFASDIMSKYEFGFLQLLDTELMDSLYPGMSAVSAQQKMVYGTMMTMNNGGAWYPGPTEQWTNNSRVVTNGSYVMMIVHENCDDIVAAFNGLF